MAGTNSKTSSDERKPANEPANKSANKSAKTSERDKLSDRKKFENETPPSEHASSAGREAGQSQAAQTRSRNASDMDDRTSFGQNSRSGERQSQDVDTVKGSNPTDMSMVEPTGEATGNEGEETGRSGKTGTGRNFGP